MKLLLLLLLVVPPVAHAQCISCNPDSSVCLIAGGNNKVSYMGKAVRIVLVIDTLMKGDKYLRGYGFAGYQITGLSGRVSLVDSLYRPVTRKIEMYYLKDPPYTRYGTIH